MSKLHRRWHQPISCASKTTAIKRVFSVAALALTCILTACSSGGASSAPTTPAVAPAIATQPAAASVFVGDAATFTVAATGTAPLNYQWLKAGASISGATSASYTTPVLTAADDNVNYSVTVSNAAGSITSSNAKLSVALHPPAITTQPASISVNAGTNATFTVVATGTTPTYQWSKNGTAISGATSASYTVTAPAVADSGSIYTVTVSNSAASVTSTPATLTVTAIPVTITTQPASVSVTAGTNATFTVVTAGTAPITYQWFKNGTAISGATSASYTVTAPALTDTGSLYTVKATNSAANVTSTAATLTVTAVPINITTQPTGATQFVGETATFSVAAGGTSPTYQWRKNSAAISGATSSTYTTPALVAGDDNAAYDVIVSNSANAITSAVATLRVGPFATSYTTQKGVKLNLFAWPGSKNAIQTKSAALDPVIMRKMLNAADGAFNYYAGATGKLPSYFLTYNGLASIAETGVGGVDLCGAGCTYIGATGMELSDDTFNALYNGIAINQYDQAMFYEFGRSFWTYGSQLEYKAPADSGCEVTGFAVLMRYRSIQALGLTGSYGTPANYVSFYNATLGFIDNYAANTSLNFNNTFLTGSYTPPGNIGGGCSDLWTSLVLRLAQNNGGEAFIQALFKEVAKRPVTVTTQDAIDNFVLASSAAANKNLTLTFGTTWRWPISVSASSEAQTRWGNPQ